MGNYHENFELPFKIIYVLHAQNNILFYLIRDIIKAFNIEIKNM